jgi:Helix-turn-helix domain
VNMMTPPEVAKELGFKADRVRAMIRAGELEAINTASRGSRRPRFQVDPSAIERWKRSRLVVPATQAKRHNPIREPSGVPQIC